ncbi:MAG TPA: hypothetical protein VJM08_11110 [Anaerolineales bacterium]|nr:hypothetical protein [Anaerolineales bacterium]
MDNEELDQYLEAQSNNLSRRDFFELIIDMLENNPSQEARRVLEIYLMTYSHVDEDRVARYLEKLLYDPAPLNREFAAFKLSILAREPDSIAYNILRDFLEEEPVEDKIWEILKERFLRLFPDENNQD